MVSIWSWVQPWIHALLGFQYQPAVPRCSLWLTLARPLLRAKASDTEQGMCF